MEPVCVNGSVHTAHKQHQRVCIQICMRTSSVDAAFTLCSENSDVQWNRVFQVLFESLVQQGLLTEAEKVLKRSVQNARYGFVDISTFAMTFLGSGSQVVLVCVWFQTQVGESGLFAAAVPSELQASTGEPCLESFFRKIIK